MLDAPVWNAKLNGSVGVVDDRNGLVGALTVTHGAWYGLSTTMHTSLPSGMHSRVHPWTQFSQRIVAT